MGERFDVVIVGAGPAGLAAGVQAATRGASHALLERAELANTIFRYQKGKFVMAEPVKLPLHPELALQFEEGSREAILEAWSKGLEVAKVNLLRGPQYEVAKVEGKKGDFTITLKDGDTLSAGHVVLSIGEQGNLRTFGVPGDDLPFVTYQLDDPKDHLDKNVVVVGVGDSGLENALALMETADTVSIVNRLHNFDRAKARNRDLIQAAINTGKLGYYEDSEVDHFEPGALFLKTPHGVVRVETDVVIGRLGAIPPRKFLQAIGIQMPEDQGSYPEVSEQFESNVPGVYLVGALTGSPLIKSCMNQGFECIEHISGNKVTPADEPILQELFRPLHRDVSTVLADIKRTIPLFSCETMTTVQLREFLAESEIVESQPGETIFARNDYSEELYSILEGEVDVAAPVSDADAAADRAAGSEKVQDVRLGTGAFFGEGSLISGRRRTATVKAAARAILIKTKRLAMIKLAKQVPEVRRGLDQAFVARRLANYMMDGDGGAPIDAHEVNALAQQAVVRTFQQGDLLWEEGAASDGLHYIRRGSVTVSRKSDGIDLVINSVAAGNYIGERALFRPQGTRTAAARAAVLVETVCLPTAAIEAFLEAHPPIRQRFEKMDLGYGESDAARMLNRRGNDLASFLMAQGFGEATDLLVIDESLCVRCDNCEKACAETHHGVSRLDREGGPTFGTIHVPIACRHCENPKCLTDCPPDAIRREASGEVFIMDNCIGCGNCAQYCPYGVIQMEAVGHEKRPSLLGRILFGVQPPTEFEGPKHAVKCDLCHNIRLRPRPDGGHGAACVASCPTGAIIRVNPHDYLDDLLGAQDD